MAVFSCEKSRSMVLLWYGKKQFNIQEGKSFFPVRFPETGKGRGDIRNERTEVTWMTIRELRAREKLSQAAFAKRIGIRPATVSRLENGLMKVSDSIADRIWEEFGTEVGEMAEQKPVKKTKPRKLEIYVQSPLGGNITPEEILAKMPEGVEACFVRIDQNLIWWVRGEETGAVEIWADDR